MKGSLTNVNSAECMADFCRIMKFPRESTEQISEFMEFREVTDGTVLISQGEMNYNIYFILSGFGVGYCFTDTGDSRYLYLQTSSYVLCSLATLAHGEASEYCCCMQRGGLVAVIDDRKLMSLAMSDVKICRWYIGVLKSALVRFEKKAANFITKDSRHRLQELYDESPEIFSNALGKQIASFIGVTPVHLSRILSSKARR